MDSKPIPFPTVRHMSPQAWRRLARSMSRSELIDLSADLAAFLGLSEAQRSELEFALTGFNWETRRQA